MQSEHNSIIHNRQQIHQCTYTPIHIITTFIEFHQCTNSSSHRFNYDMTHQLLQCTQCSRLFQMHAVPSPTTRCQHNILCKSKLPLTIHLCKSTPPFTLLIWLNTTMMHGHTSKDPIMQNLQHIYPPTTM